MQLLNADSDVPGLRKEFHRAAGLTDAVSFIPAGLGIIQHTHRYDHFAVLLSGEIDLFVDNTVSRHVGPKVMLIEAHKAHGVRAITDTVWHCIFDQDAKDWVELEAKVVDRRGDVAAMREVAEAMS